MEYYYIPRDNIDLKNNILYVDNFEYKHLIKVLRKKVEDKITLTDGERNIYNCIITSIDKRKIICNIISMEFNLYEPSKNISLYLAPLRNSERLEFAIEKAVEIGVTSIHLMITEHVENKNLFSALKLERLSKIIIRAMSQSQRCYLPKLYNTISLDEMFKLTSGCLNKIVMYEFSDDPKKSFPENANEVLLAIGPEGGFTKDEISLFINNNWQVKSLGNRKLRAETAAIIAVYKLI